MTPATNDADHQASALPHYRLDQDNAAPNEPVAGYDIDVITAVGREDPWLIECILSVSEFARASGARVRHWLASDGIDHAYVEAQTLAARDAGFEGRLWSHPVFVPATPLRTGPGRTRNRALRLGTAPLVMALDSDDAYVPEEMADLYRHLVEQIRIAALHAGHPENIHQVTYDAAGRALLDPAYAAGRTEDISVEGNHEWNGPAIHLMSGIAARDIVRDYADQYGWAPWHCCAAIIRRAALEGVGGWDESLTFVRSEDVAMFARVSRAWTGLFSHHQVLRWRKHLGSLSNSAEWGYIDTRIEGEAMRHLLDSPVASTGSFTTDLALASHDQAGTHLHPVAAHESPSHHRTLHLWGHHHGGVHA